jgi:2-polyprenyl-6-methoxyphenol hydroxylase-like FAD-dependent oxidoreductase
MRRKIAETSLCSLYTGCRVTGRSSEVPPIVEYTDSQGSGKQIRGQFLVGADGKTGIVRKHFLEPTAGIRQEAGHYPYEGVWVASNLKMTLPTPETHPEFPLWQFGYTPEEVYDLFWPVGWHFCAPPGKPTATGRFGPHADRTWRHEFRVYNEASGPIYSEEMLWEDLMPHITLEKDPARGVTFGKPVEYPRDCIKILRCRPFKFVHKCVNRWFDKRTILIGDAAHVFPPFAGQGVASGARDAHQLAWRLALLLQDEDRIDKRLGLLEAWALERRRSVDDAALISKLSGFACNNQPAWWVFLLARIIKALERVAPSLWRRYDAIAATESRGFSNVPGGFYLPAYKGGVRLAQVHMLSSRGDEPFLSDNLLRSQCTIFTLLIISDGDKEQRVRLQGEAEAAIKAASFAPEVLSVKSVAVYAAMMPADDKRNVSTELFAPAPPAMIKVPVKGAYDSTAFVNRLSQSTRFAILRPDWFVFACARDAYELEYCLSELKKALRLE